jgi:hypothetical protein
MRLSILSSGGVMIGAAHDPLKSPIRLLVQAHPAAEGVVSQSSALFHSFSFLIGTPRAHQVNLVQST